MKGFMKKNLALVLLFCMVFSAFCGVMPITADAAGYLDYEDYDLLGYGFNILADKELTNSNIVSGLLESADNINAYNTYIGETHATASAITDMSKYFESEATTWNAALDVNVRARFVAIDVESKFSHNGAESYSQAASSYFSSVDVEAIAYLYDMGLKGNTDLLWDNLTDSFKTDLLNDSVSPQTLFANYGTHMITKYQCGGVASSYTSGVSNETGFSNATDWSTNTKVQVDTNVVFSGTAELGYQNQKEANGTTSGTQLVSNSYVRGGVNFFTSPSQGTIDADKYSNWLASLTSKDVITNGTTTQILTDDQLELVGIWELIPDEYASRKAYLKNYFNAAITDELADFYGEYIYNEYNQSSLPDFSQYKDYTWISTPEELDAVRNNLNGKYFIVNDIDLTSYDWEPIGTESKPFTGALIGNDIEIIGLSSLVSGNDTRFPGVLGYNSGTVSGIDISKWVDYPVLVNDVVNGTEYLCTSVAGLPTSFNCDSYGGTVVIDWSKETNSTVNKIFTIGNNVSSVYFKGKSGTSFSGLQIVVASRSTPLDIIFESFNYTASAGQIALNASATSQRVSIIAKSGSNTIIGGYGAAGTSRGTAAAGEDTWSTSNIHGTNASAGAVAVYGKNIVIEGSGNMTIVGGNGGAGGSGKSFENVVQNGSSDRGYGGNGGAGGNGAIAVSVQNLKLLNKGSLYVIGGDGGAGGAGGIAPQSDRDGQATAGYGGTGGNGGTGASAISATGEVVIYGDFTKTVIMSGGGGAGGAGGTGGEGDDEGNHYRDNGGTGGNGGNGGNTYSALVANVLNVSGNSDYDNLVITGYRFEEKTGTVSSEEITYRSLYKGAGTGGAGGNGGAAHKRDGWYDDRYIGTNGDGGNGGKGGSAEYAVKVNQLKVNAVKDSSITNAAYPIKDKSLVKIVTSLWAGGSYFELESSWGGGAGSGGSAGSAGAGEGGYDGSAGSAGNSGSKKSTVHYVGSSVNRAGTPRLGLNKVVNKQYYKNGLIDSSTINCDVYENGSYADTNNWVSQYSFNESGVRTVAVHSGDLSAYYPVRVAEVEITKIEIADGTKKNYYYGEEIEPPVINVYYNDGSSTPAACDTSNVISGSTSSLGSSTVNVKYQNAYASYTISVSAMPISGSAKINGTAQFGRTLSASFSVAPSGATYKVQWYRNSEAISGATGASYTLTSADIGQSITYAVIGTGNYSGEIVSADVVAEKAPVTGSVSISGTAQPYSTVTADTSNVSPSAVTLSYQWYKNGAAISGATANSYVLTADEVGKSVTVKITGTGNYTGEITSPAVVPVAASANGTLTITGSASYGGTLSAVVSDLNPADAQYTYQWYRDGVAISGATSGEYTVSKEDIGKSISVKIIGTNGFDMTISAAAVIPEKETVTAPEAPKAVEVTADTVTLEYKEGYEYKMGDGEWQSSNVFTGLEPDTTYVFYQRTKETETSFVSPESEIAIKTLPIYVSGVSLDKSEESIIKTYSSRLTATVMPANATDKTVLWSSADESIATVNENGIVTAVSVGKTTITAKTADGGFEASCIIEVLPNEYTVTWNVDGEKTSDKFVYTEEIEEPEDSQKSGYSFAGWTPSIPSYMPANDLEFTAVFTPVKYIARFVADGITVESVAFTVETTELSEPQIPAKTGYTAEWEEYTLGLDSIVVNAVYTPITYTAVFKADGVTVEEIPFTVETESLTAPEIPEKTGYTAAWASYEIKAENITVNAIYTPITYTATFYADGEVVDVTEFTVESPSIITPQSPSKNGYAFSRWTPEMPESIPAKNLEFEAEFVNITSVSIKTPSISTVKYGDTLILHAQVSDLPDGAKLVWSASGSGISIRPSADGMTCSATSVNKGDTTVTVKVVDKDGNVLKNANGAEVKDEYKLGSKAGFFQKLISFFKNLFGVNRVIAQAFNIIF